MYHLPKCIQNDLLCGFSIQPYKGQRRRSRTWSPFDSNFGLVNSRSRLDSITENSLVIHKSVENNVNPYMVSRGNPMDSTNNSNETVISSEVDKSPKLYKTELCELYMLDQKCRFGSECVFAHGFSELRSKTHPSTFKTKVCKNYRLTKQCKYGKRCHFIHQ